MEQNIMRETITRNRVAINRDVDKALLDSFEIVNNTVPLSIIEHCGKNGVEYILADGFIIGYGEPTP